jgi:UDP:flavonoid glycosyltransferase YjiC (YdhE family)
VVAKKRILFVAENVALANVVRLVQLARCLDPARHEVHFACSDFEPMIFEGTDFTRVPIGSMSARRMYRRVSSGARIYPRRTLAGYVRQELPLLERLQPDLVVGDLRLSLTVSAPKLGIPYAPLINAYWDPPGGREAFPMPEHPIINLLGVQRVAPHFHKGLPFVLRYFAAPVNALRRRYGLPPIGDLLDVLMYGDHVLHPDVPELAPASAAQPHRHYLGPVQWAPRLPLPAFWDAMGEDQPIVYVTLGSSGGLRAARVVLQALSQLPVQVLLASAGRMSHERLPDNVFAADFLPGDLCARRAALVICNGGSSTGYQALAEGTPVLGLPFNMDQYLSMAAIERAGAGRGLRSGTATVEQVRQLTEALVRDDAAREAALRTRKALLALDARERFPRLVAALLGSAAAVPASTSQRPSSAPAGA